jgi:hypothetical protein
MKKKRQYINSNRQLAKGCFDTNLVKYERMTKCIFESSKYEMMTGVNPKRLKGSRDNLNIFKNEKFVNFISYYINGILQ